METLRTDCLVIGAGLAGAAYALNAARMGLNVALVSRGGNFDANSDRAQGGIIYDPAGLDGSLPQDI
ncbi:MAG: FAD-binding protein, partial [Gammaproteobacteria bacterium]|nr:FAD-binding protein [Gammaproteobacteria bacterium]